MTTLTAAKALLEADATLLAIATGGVWDWDETGRMGINRTNTAAAFTSGIIKPCLLLKLRTSVPFGGIADDASRIVSARDMIEVWAYADNAFTAITSMLDRVYTLLQGQRLSGGKCRFAGSFQPPRDQEMDAFVQRDDYAVVF
jgi:hypothetical protein